MARRRGSMAPWGQRRLSRKCNIQLPGCSLECTTCRIPASLWMCLSSCWDARGWLGRRAAAEWAFGLACAALPRPHVVARRGGRGMMYCQHGRLIGQDARVPRWAVAQPGVGASATRARCVGGGAGGSSPSMAFMRSSAAGRIVRCFVYCWFCLLYTSPSPRDRTRSRMPSSA